jgi:hypothetical protein
MIFIIWRAPGGPDQCTRCLEWQRADTFIGMARQMGAEIVRVFDE